MDFGKWRLVAGSKTCRLAGRLNGRTLVGARYGGPFHLPYSNCTKKEECTCEWAMVEKPAPAQEPVEREIPVLDPWDD